MSRIEELLALERAFPTVVTPRKKPACSVADCARPRESRGLCTRHYAQLRRRGDPEAPRLPTGAPAQPAFMRMWDRVDTSGDCWEYSPSIQGLPGGYRQINEGGKQRLAHRVVWETVVGSIPAGYEIGHTCDNGACVRLSHLRCVTHSANEYYKRDKGAFDGYPEP